MADRRGKSWQIGSILPSPAGGGVLRRIARRARRRVAVLLDDAGRLPRLTRHSRLDHRVEPKQQTSRAAGVPPLDIASEPILEAREDWKAHFAATLAGRGLELGPLHEPLPKSQRASVEYLDRLPLEALRKHYSELPPDKIVAPDILDDAETLRSIADETYDFVSASHVIEHMRNPIAALENWCRVLKPNGRLYLVVPDKRATFDRGREQTTLEHMLFDYYDPSRERDREHFLDWSVKVDGKAGTQALQAARYLEDMDYSIHFHVFLPSDIAKLLTWFHANVTPVDVLEGPVMTPESFEFHVMLRKRPVLAC